MRALLVGTGVMIALALGVLLPALPELQAGGKRSDDKVKVSATAAKPDASGKQVVTVTFVIERGWHIYANPVGHPDLNETRTVIEVKANGKSVGTPVYPRGKEIVDKDVGRYRVYEEKVSIPVNVERGGEAGSLEVSVRFNACNDKGCLPPATVKLKVK